MKAGVWAFKPSDFDVVSIGFRCVYVHPHKALP
jgi:hypothetical protein